MIQIHLSWLILKFINIRINRKLVLREFLFLKICLNLRVKVNFKVRRLIKG